MLKTSKYNFLISFFLTKHRFNFAQEFVVRHENNYEYLYICLNIIFFRVKAHKLNKSGRKNWVKTQKNCQKYDQSASRVQFTYLFL